MARQILLIDDSDEMAVLVEFALEDTGWTLAVACTVAAGLDRLQESLPDLLLLDNELTDGTGLEVLQRIRTESAWKALPVVIFSANSHLDPGYEQWGMRGHISKPFDLLTFASEILKIMAMGTWVVSSIGGRSWDRISAWLVPAT